MTVSPQLLSVLFRLVALGLATGILFGCAGTPQGPVGLQSTQTSVPRAMAPQRPCDDGGSGGVLIDGVCL